MTASPVPMRLHCEVCHTLHVDEGEFATKPHHTHACQHCGAVWRPAIGPTVGVQFLPGFKNPEADGGAADPYDKWEALKSLVGNYRNGSQEIVTLFWDEATETAVIKVGDRSYCRDRCGLDTALSRAIQENRR